MSQQLYNTSANLQSHVHNCPCRLSLWTPFSQIRLHAHEHVATVFCSPLSNCTITINLCYSSPFYFTSGLTNHCRPTVRPDPPGSQQCARGNAIIAELSRLAEYIPPIYRQNHSSVSKRGKWRKDKPPTPIITLPLYVYIGSKTSQYQYDIICVRPQYTCHFHFADFVAVDDLLF